MRRALVLGLVLVLSLGVVLVACGTSEEGTTTAPPTTAGPATTAGATTTAGPATTAAVTTTAASTAAIYALMLLVLLVRPRGLFGERLGGRALELGTLSVY